MGRTIEDVYNSIGQGLVNAIPEKWVLAEMEVSYFGDAADFTCRYKKENKEIEPIFGDENALEDFIELHKIMTAEGQHDWNRATFTLYPDGNFDIEFQYDEELAAEIERLKNEPDERFD